MVVAAQVIPEQLPAYYEAAFFSECYKTAMVNWLKLLGGNVPGGVWYEGAGPVMCQAAITKDGENIVVLNALDIDGDMEPELKFEKMPASIERMQGDGSWRPIRFEKIASGGCRLFSPILTQRAAIFRLK